MNELITLEKAKEIIKPLSAIFTLPNLNLEQKKYFWKLLCERAVDNKLKSEHLQKAVNHVIDSKHFDNLFIADIIAYAVELKNENLYEKGN